MPILAFTSPKGGVGKSTLAAHVAGILRARGHQVLALDLDPQNALRLHLGVSMQIQSGFMSRIDANPDWRSSRVATESGVELLPFGPADPSRTLRIAANLLSHPELLAEPLRDMLAQPGLVIVLDTPPGPSAALEAVIPLVDLFCMVLLADAGSAAMIPDIAHDHLFGRGTLAQRHAERVGVVVNQVNLGQPLGSAVMDCVVRTFGHRLLGAICLDPALSEALAQKQLLTDGNSGAAEDLQVLADKIALRLQLAAPARSAAGFRALSEWGLR
jgi:cellulose synthase operon protein YhjQ